jgi:hypothetical protein
MRRARRWLLIAVPLATVAALLVVGLWVSLGRTNRITKANFEKIQVGMTIAEVQALLGQDSVPIDDGFHFRMVTAEYREEDWTGVPVNQIYVEFENGKVSSKTFVPWTAAERRRAFWRHVRARLGL